jgi:hypothetical protein
MKARDNLQDGVTNLQFLLGEDSPLLELYGCKHHVTSRTGRERVNPSYPQRSNYGFGLWWVIAKPLLFGTRYRAYLCVYKGGMH